MSRPVISRSKPFFSPVRSPAFPTGLNSKESERRERANIKMTKLATFPALTVAQKNLGTQVDDQDVAGFSTTSHLSVFQDTVILKP